MAAEELSVTEQIEAMINGTHEDQVEEDGVNEEIGEESEVEEEVEYTETEEETETEENEESEEDAEDTDQETDSEEEDDTNEENDDSAEETSDTEEEDQDENSQAENEESEEDSENTEEEKTDSEEINYKEFYEKVALAKFTANGKEVEGFKDPEDLIRAQQMLHGYSDKMKVLKENKRFLKPLIERGITEDPDKFNLAMNLFDGDIDAIKQVLKDKNIDPLRLDLEDLNYTPKNVLPSDAQLIIEDAYEQAENLGVADKFNRVISKDWDVQSLQEFIKNSAVRNDLVQHLSNGTYDIVQGEIRRMELLDTNGSLDNVPAVEKYRIAMGRLQRQYAKENLQVNHPTTPSAKKDTPPVKTAEEKAVEEAEFKRKAKEKAKKEAEVAEQRKKAASVTKRKPKSKPKPAPRIEELSGKAFENAFNEMLMS